MNRQVASLHPVVPPARRIIRRARLRAAAVQTWQGQHAACQASNHHAARADSSRATTAHPTPPPRRTWHSLHDRRQAPSAVGLPRMKPGLLSHSPAAAQPAAVSAGTCWPSARRRGPGCACACTPHRRQQRPHRPAMQHSAGRPAPHLGSSHQCPRNPLGARGARGAGAAPAPRGGRGWCGSRRWLQGQEKGAGRQGRHAGVRAPTRQQELWLGPWPLLQASFCAASAHLPTYLTPDHERGRGGNRGRQGAEHAGRQGRGRGRTMLPRSQVPAQLPQEAGHTAGASPTAA